LYSQLASNRYWPPDQQLDGAILVLETSESMIPAQTVYEFLSALGERQILQLFVAILFGRAKTVDRGRMPHEGRDEYRKSQREAVVRAISEYVVESPLPILVFDIDFGHTDPQIIIPLGAIAEVDSSERRIIFDYSSNGGQL